MVSAFVASPVIGSGSSPAPLGLPAGRLTLTTLTPVLIADVTSSATVLYTPHQGSTIPIYTGSGWVQYAFTELTNTLANSSVGSAGPAAAIAASNYDLFVWNNAGTITLTRGTLWGSDTARTLTLTLQDGIYVNTSAITNGPAAKLGTYVGTIMTDAATATVTFNRGLSGTTTQAAWIGLWNMYNRKQPRITVTDSTASWTYTTATLRASNASNANRVTFVRGLDEELVLVSFAELLESSAVGGVAAIFLGLDSTSAGQVAPVGSRGALVGSTVGGGAVVTAFYEDYPGLGKHFIQACEIGDGGNANIFFGGNSYGLKVLTSF